MSMHVASKLVASVLLLVCTGCDPRQTPPREKQLPAADDLQPNLESRQQDDRRDVPLRRSEQVLPVAEKPERVEPHEMSRESAAFRRSEEIVRLFLKPDREYRIFETDEYKNSNRTVVKGALTAEGVSCKWSVMFHADGNLLLFSFDGTDFLDQRPGGYLSFLPRNQEYITHDFFIMPTLEDLRTIGVEAEEVR